MHRWRRLFGEAEETWFTVRNQRRILNRTRHLFKVTKPLVYPVCGHRLVGILLSARVYKLRSGANNVIKNSPASNLSTLLRVFAGRLRWVAVLRSSQPWSRPTKN